MSQQRSTPRRRTQLPTQAGVLTESQPLHHGATRVHPEPSTTMSPPQGGASRSICVPLLRPYTSIGSREECLRTPERTRRRSAMTQNVTDLWTTTEASQYLGITPRTLRRWARVNYVPHVRLGPDTARAIRFCPEILGRWARSQDLDSKNGSRK